MLIAGYILAALVGISLGLIGSGGSVLTVPILVYIMGVNPVLATSYSLFIVGSTALAGTVNNYFKKQVNTKTALLFGITSVLTVYATRRWMLPAIPHTLFWVKHFEVTKPMATMVLFAILMLFSSVAMIKNNRQQDIHNSKPALQHNPVPVYLGYGILIGLVTGLLGAGGGFLIIPVLVLLLKLPMKEAVGTSLLIIALNSLLGFAGDIGHYTIDWKFLLGITAIATAGIFIGVFLSRKIPGEKLKKAFGWFVLVMGLYIICKEIFFPGLH